MDGTHEKLEGASLAPSGDGTAGTAEQRRQYRISSGFEGILAFALVLADGSEHPAELVDVSAGGACLRWPIKDLVVLDVWQEIRLCAKSSMAKQPIMITAQVRWCGPDDEAHIRYGVEFLDLDDQPDQISPALRWLFNRRRSPR
jgi:c-di-GMP-binding flagellar brake protein YcgR